jgi:DNA-binding transcriptional regulator YhcF (GntR family)
MSIPSDTYNISSGNISSSSILTQAYLNVTQSITQGFISAQIASLDCKKNDDLCNKCIKMSSEYNLADKDFSQACPICMCNIKNMKMESVININLDSKMFLNSRDEFISQFKNSINQKTLESGTSLFNFNQANDKTKNLINTVNEAFDIINSDNFQSSLQTLKTFQIVNVNNPNTNLINIDMNLTTKFINDLMQNTSNMSILISKMDNNILSITSSEIESVDSVLISWIVTLSIIFILGLVFIFGVQIVLETLSLYAST